MHGQCGFDRYHVGAQMVDSRCDCADFRPNRMEYVAVPCGLFDAVQIHLPFAA
jgi:hypothetical protein